MKVLELNQYYLTLAGILPNDKGDTGKLRKLCTNVLFVWCFLYALIACSCIHIYHNPSVASAMDAFIGLFAGVLGFGSYIGIAANGKSTKLLIDELQKIVDEGKFIK